MNFFKKFTAPNISKLEQQKDVAGLLAALDYKDAAIPFLAIQALGRMENKSSFRALASIIKERKEFQAAAVEALKKSSENGMNSLVNSLDGYYNPDKSQREISADCIQIIGEPIVPILIKKAMQFDVAQVIAKMGPPVVEPLIAAYKETLLKTKSGVTASKYIAILGNVKDNRVGDFLMPLLQNSDGSIRDEAATGLGNQREKRAVEALICILLNKTEEHSVRRSAAFALGKIGDSRAIEPLIQALSDPDGMVRKESANALGQPGLGQGIEPTIDKLLADLKSSDKKVRQNAVALLGALSKPRTFDAIKGLLEDEDGWVCWEASLAIQKVDKERGQKVIEELCRVSHKFGETQTGEHYNELVTRCMRCGYEKKEQRLCKKCGGVQFEVYKDDWNDESYVICKQCREKVS
jgi:HEAT repeat protein